MRRRQGDGRRARRKSAYSVNPLHFRSEFSSKRSFATNTKRPVIAGYFLLKPLMHCPRLLPSPTRTSFNQFTTPNTRYVLWVITVNILISVSENLLGSIGKIGLGVGSYNCFSVGAYARLTKKWFIWLYGNAPRTP